MLCIKHWFVEKKTNNHTAAQYFKKQITISKEMIIRCNTTDSAIGLHNEPNNYTS